GQSIQRSAALSRAFNHDAAGDLALSRHRQGRIDRDGAAHRAPLRVSEGDRLLGWRGDRAMIHIDDLELYTESHGDRYEVRVKLLGREAGGRDLGCMLHEIPPGKHSWPYHFHWANEEAIYVLAGQGILRTPQGEIAVGPGDYMAFPVGPEYAHQMI